MLNNIAGVLAPFGSVPGDYESIFTTTVGAGGTSNITFSSIPSTYKHLQIRGIMRSSAAVDRDYVKVQVGNGSADTGSNYPEHRLYADGSSVYAYGGASSTGGFLEFSTGGSNPANIFGAGYIDILDYKSTNKYKTIRMLGGLDTNGFGLIGFTSSAWMNTAAIDTIKLTLNSGNFTQYSQFALYGIKG